MGKALEQKERGWNLFIPALPNLRNDAATHTGELFCARKQNISEYSFRQQCFLCDALQ